MILGKIKDLGRYKYISNNVKEAIDWIEKEDLINLPLGKTEIKGKEIYCNRLSYVAKDYDCCKAENHNNYLDIQIVIKGNEGFGYADIKNPTLKVTEPYNEIKDATKYAVKDELIYQMEDGSFALVFPEDIHKPMIKVDNNNVEKLVVKIKIDF